MASQNALRLSAAFQNAKKDFLDSLKDPSLFDSVSNITSIHDVYTFTTQLQNDQSNRQGLRNLRKIAPYLDRLKQYAGVVEVFVQVKPEIMALIWGPIKLLLQMSDNLTQSFDAIVDAMAVIGNNLPLFEAYAMLFEESNRVADVLVLFYKDILDFYEIALNFFAAKRWVFIFDSVWPRHKAKINVVVSSIERHCLLMTEEVNLENISGAHRARIADMDRWKRNFEFQERQNFNSVEAYISPKLYDDDLDRLQRTICERTGRWLKKEQTLKEWFDPRNASTRVVWLQGIPGADLLKCVGPAYIIIDGLDEIPESERMVEILHDLLDVIKDSTETKLLISSRAQDEIAAVLKKATPKVIRVDDKNSGCIQAYVSFTSEKWLLQSGFDEDACSEIKSLLASLSAKAKGMFLYARVVMDNIQLCHTFDLIQSELKVLPENLEEAYSRILQRLNYLQPSSRVMSQRALGWIGCSPVPVTIQELSFALSLHIDGEDEPPRSESLLNIVRLCGPIVETSDDYVYFVHFTVKE
ncbi:NACHT nucleoside triphosphatase [Penicillium canescens]|nr:NACHT nucleoside triphosphatase [Penicillium canescens]